MEKITYIDNDQDLGIKYNWPKIFKRCRKLKIYPDDPTIWNPLNIPIRARWQVILSIRSKGKTTNILLLGLVMNEMYGTTTIYVGQNPDQIRPKNTNRMYNIIRDRHYIEKIYNNRWNDIRLKTGGKWHLVNVDTETGQVLEMSPDPVCVMVNCADHEDYKSTMNYPRADLFIYDEFIRKNYYPNEFIDFCDLLSTFNRNRLSSIVFLTANTINKHYQYFNELDIYEAIQPLQAGQNTIVEGTHHATVYVEIIDPAINEKRKRVNISLFGFKNPALGAITGDTTWTEFNFPHCIKTEPDQVLFRNCYIYHNKKLLNLEIVNNKVGICINAHFANKSYDDSIMYTTEPIYDSRYRYKFGTPSRSKIDKLITDLIKTNKIYFASNDCGSFFQNYVEYCKMIK